MKYQDLHLINKLREARRPCVVVSELATGAQRVLLPDEGLPSDMDVLLLEAIKSSLAKGASRLVSLDKGDTFIQVYLPRARLVIIGAVHISQSLIPMANETGFHCLVVDPRSAFASTSRFERLGNMTLLADWPEDVVNEMVLDPYTALVALTHDPKIDDLPLQMALEAGCFYVGALGSRKTHAARCERLREKGVSDEDLASIEAPIGLDIGAASPSEIAVAILASLIAQRHKISFVHEE